MDLPDEDGFQKEVDTVRALHQTVVSLRAALEQSRLEIEELKERVWSSETCEIVLQNLSVENHVLRQRIIDVNDLKENTTQTSLPHITTTAEISVNDTNNNDNPQIIVTDSQALNAQPIKSTRFNLNYDKAQENLTKSPKKSSKLIINNTGEELPLNTDNKIRSIATKLPVNTEKKIHATEKEELPLNTDKKTSKISPRSAKKIPVNTEENSSSSSKKSKKKFCGTENKPRQTIVTVNVTLKSPKRSKVLTTMEEENPNPPEADTNKGMDYTEGEEVDDIELIFTTDDTTTSVIKEELVSIADGDGEDCDTPVLLNYRTVDFDTPDLRLSCENLNKELDDDDVFHENETTDNFENENTENLNFQINNSAGQNIHNSKSDNSINREDSSTLLTTDNDSSHKDKCYSYQDSSFESRSLDKDESFDKFDDKEKYLHRMWSNNSVLVETDISKCGIVDSEVPISSARRNTCPNPVPYRPIMHREALAKHNPRSMGVKFNSRYDGALRPILNENQSPKTESEAQTDISALPSLWKSESYLAHKVSHQFTTLPSKFPIPNSQKSLRLSEKTKEARRVLLSDINFTSMVPELSRSADHLYQEGLEVMQTCGYGQYLNPPGPQLRRYNTGDSLTSPNFMNQSSQKFAWSPSDYSNFSSTKFDNSNPYINRYRGSLSSINNQHSFDLSDFNVKRRSYSTSTAHWKHNQPASFDNSRFMQSGQGPYRSVPTSPTRTRSIPVIYSNNSFKFRHSNSRYGGSGFRYINGSLPELHGDHDSGDSTDSLVEEAEQYLRSSIDCIVSGRDMSHIVPTSRRRASAPSPGRDSSPPRNWKPFLPHGIKDLRSDNWVKVIGPEGKIKGGRVRYVGYVLGQQEPYVGIELATSVGNSDGVHNNRRYFECPPNHALFIPFKKVVMGWRN